MRVMQAKLSCFKDFSTGVAVIKGETFREIFSLILCSQMCRFLPEGKLPVMYQLKEKVS